TFDEYFNSLGLNVSMEEMLYLKKNLVEKDLDVNNRYLKAYFATFKSDNERLSNGVVVVLHDITEIQRLELSRREFVANVSHELRTPLTTIKTYSETMIDNTENEEDKYYLNVIGNEVDRMTRLVKDLLTLSSLDHRKLSIVKTTFSLDKLLYEVVTKLSVDAKNNGKVINYTLSSEIPPVSADRDRIEQVITNIISNSVKYTGDDGVINVYAGFLYNEAYIKIKDNGIGIPKESLPKIFDRFYRVDKHRSREQGGTGLGLSIAYEIIKQHNGTIYIDSDVGQGTEVIIKLPVNKTE
ncbi:MAG: PAS domain-containing sensor histidine kinase, partial [Clostridia bacterium]|nr:PAS domain-containing sensor histidine kinase [Clostridia bacterium]